MRYIAAVLGSIFMCLAVWFLCTLILSFVVPRAWIQIEVGIGYLSGSPVSLISALAAGIAGTYTFKASLGARTGRLYRRPSRRAR